MATLTETTLDPDERRAPDRLVDLLREEYGSDLHAVWLYGSRARGEQTGPESDIDVMVITARGRGEWEAMSRLLRRAAADVEAEPWTFSIHPYGPEDLVRARAIESFFVREVDRDKIVLFGDESAPILTQGGENLRSGLFEGKMKSRSEEFMRVARRRLRAALVVADTGDFDSAVEPAYYASLNAARAALSEEDLYARTTAACGTSSTRPSSPPGASIPISTRVLTAPRRRASGPLTRPSSWRTRGRRRSSRARSASWPPSRRRSSRRRGPGAGRALPRRRHGRVPSDEGLLLVRTAPALGRREIRQLFAERRAVAAAVGAQAEVLELAT